MTVTPTNASIVTYHTITEALVVHYFHYKGGGFAYYVCPHRFDLEHLVTGWKLVSYLLARPRYYVLRENQIKKKKNMISSFGRFDRGPEILSTPIIFSTSHTYCYFTVHAPPRRDRYIHRDIGIYITNQDILKADRGFYMRSEANPFPFLCHLSWSYKPARKG